MDVSKVHAKREKMHKKAAENNTRNRKEPQQINNGRTNVVPVKFYIGGNAMIYSMEREKHTPSSE